MAPDWVEAARQGSLDALGELYREHADAVYTLAFRITGSAPDADDVLQDVFVGLPRALRNYRERGSFLYWLKRLVVRTCLMRMRQSSRRGQHVELAPDLVGTRDDSAVERVAVQRALHRLPESQRVVFMLAEVEGYTHAEIAEMLGISAANSATRLSRAWTQLRKELKQ
jgi:RNA polymerase sigma factor (sigma-70 family)